MRRRRLVNFTLDFSCLILTEPGHPVNLCPTNDDSSFDTAPGHFYKCKHCQRQGDHYSMFCPENPEASSIMDRRKHMATSANKTALGSASKVTSSKRTSSRESQEKEPDINSKEHDEPLNVSVHSQLHPDCDILSTRTSKQYSLSYGRLSSDEEHETWEEEKQKEAAEACEIGPLMGNESMEFPFCPSDSKLFNFSNNGKHYSREYLNSGDEFPQQNRIAPIEISGIITLLSR
jgi:hypothetical protein